MADQLEQYIPLVPKADFLRADFKPEYFDTAIRQKGYSVIWEQAMFCSCIDTQSGQPDYLCPACSGKAYIYFGAKETKAVVTSINGHKEQIRIGLHDMGSAYLTPLSTDNVGFRDRFTFVDFRTKYSEVLVKSDGDDIVRYPMDEIMSVRQLDREFIQGKDFTKSDDGKSLIWMTSPIYVGDKFSILYTTPPVYVAINPVHELRGTYTMYKGQGQERFVHLPKQFQIKREDFLENER